MKVSDGKHRSSLRVRALKPPYPPGCTVFERENGEVIVLSPQDSLKIRSITGLSGRRTMNVIVIDDEDYSK